MYLHDYAYAYPEGNSSVGNGLNSWIHFRKDGYNSSTSNEWFSTRWGIHSVDNSDVLAYRISYEGPIYGGNGSWNFLGNGNSIRPVFYLTNAITLNGNGTKIEPFTINISSE